MKNLIYIFFCLFLLIGCSGLKDAGKVLRNEKIRTTDEFLVKKRNPLILPPNYEEIPEPGFLKNKKENEKEKIKKLLKVPEKIEKNNSSSSVEKSILDKIRNER